MSATVLADCEFPSPTRAQTSQWPEFNQKQTSREPKDHFVIRDGVEFAGTHLIVDFWGAKRLADLAFMEQTLRDCVISCGATLLHIHLHHFTATNGISGVAVLAESHISVHTWPEREYAAFDIFMCGDATPERAIPVLQQAYQPEKMKITEERRGIVEK